MGSAGFNRNYMTINLPKENPDSTEVASTIF
ncbi:unnamed protein product, partial [marine sediment metagenome]